MSRRRWIAHRPGADENRKAALLAAGVAGVLGAVLFYVARMFLARERIAPRDRGRVASRDPGRSGSDASGTTSPGRKA